MTRFVFVLIAVVLVPFGTALWGASFTISYGFGTDYWIEWRNLGISNAVTTVVLVPVFLLGAHHLFVRRPRALPPRRVLEAALVGACTVALGIFVFDNTPAGPTTSPALLYRADSSAHLVGAPLRPRRNQRLDVDRHVPGDLGNDARARSVPGPDSRRKCPSLQLFLLVTATPLMLLAVVIEEERRSKEALRESANLMGLAAEAGKPRHVGVGCFRQRCVDDRARTLAVWPQAGRAARFCGNVRSRSPRGPCRP